MAAATKWRADRTITAQQLGEVLGVTARRVQQLAREGVLPRTGRGRYPLGRCVQAFVGFWQQRAEDADRSPDLERERAALVRVQRQTAELELARKRGDLITIGDAAEEAERVLAYVRSKVFALPGRLGPQLVNIVTVGEAIGRVDQAIGEVLGELTAGADALEADDG